MTNPPDAGNSHTHARARSCTPTHGPEDSVTLEVAPHLIPHGTTIGSVERVRLFTTLCALKH